MDARWFKTKLKNQGKTQADLAKHLNIEPSAVSRMLKGNRQLRLHEMGSIAAFIDASIPDVMHHAGINISTSYFEANNNAVREEAVAFENPYQKMITIQEINDFSDLEDPSCNAVNHWQLPLNFIENRTKTSLKYLFMMTVRDDGMSPQLPLGTKVLVDTLNCQPSPPGFFLVWDDVGYRIKRLELLTNQSSSTLKVSCNNPNYEDYCCTPENIQVKGRIIAQFSYL